jgi:transposase
MKRNQYGRFYVRGKALDEEMRTRVIDLYRRGDSFKTMSEKCGISRSACWKMVKTYQTEGSLAPKANLPRNKWLAKLPQI